MPPRKSRRRRDKGTGSVTYHKARNKYVARMMDKGIGTPPKKSFDTYEQADAWLDQKLRDARDGIAIEGIPTLEAWLTHWHTNIVKVRVTTHEDYGDVIHTRIVPYLGKFHLDELERQPEKIEQWITQTDIEHLLRDLVRRAGVPGWQECEVWPGSNRRSRCGLRTITAPPHLLLEAFVGLTYDSVRYSPCG
jgi:hypothetical protein